MTRPAALAGYGCAWGSNGSQTVTVVPGALGGRQADVPAVVDHDHPDDGKPHLGRGPGAPGLHAPEHDQAEQFAADPERRHELYPDATRPRSGPVTPWMTASAAASPSRAAIVANTLATVTAWSTARAPLATAADRGVRHRHPSPVTRSDIL